VTARRSFAVVLLTASPSIAWAHGLEAFVIVAAIAGGVIGLAAGGLSAWRGWHPIKSFLVAVAVFVVITTVPDLASGPFDIAVLLGSLVLAPLVGLIPVGAGYIIGRWVVPLRARRPIKAANGNHT
jgi:hypothetical protein